MTSERRNPENAPLSSGQAKGVPTRSFHMGFTPTCFDDRPATWDKIYETIYSHADLLYVTLGARVPWPEALAGTPYPEPVERELQLKRERLRPHLRVYLVIDCLSMHRNDLAAYWATSSEDPADDYWMGKALVAEGWENRRFDDPEVIQAYANHCRRMIRKFQPDFMTYGSEVNIFASKTPDSFRQFLFFLESVYSALKRENPNLPLLLTNQIDFLHDSPEHQKQVIKQLLPFTDFLVASTYPYMVEQNPAALPARWFDELAEIDPSQPFAIAETACIAKPMPRLGPIHEPEFLDRMAERAWREGSEEVQAAYAQRLLEDANRLNARFVNWYFVQDFDEPWGKMRDPAARQLAINWRDSGMVDSSGNPRAALRVWDRWLARPLRWRSGF